jgi:hypothetical protein
MNVYQKLATVQSKLKVSKDNFNAFGKYNYRSCEDILEGVKPLLKEVNAVVTLTDEIKQIGDRFYVSALARFIDTESESLSEISTTALAREDLDKKGMDLAQVTGSVSSYARKYALNGLFCIDDTKDADSSQPAQKPVDVNAQMAMFKSLCNDRGMTEDEVNDMENAVCNAKKNPNFQDLVSSVVDNFEKTYKWWVIEK